MARLKDLQTMKLDARIAYLRRKVLQAERTLAREIKRREMPCRCQRGESEFSQEDFEQFREIFETARASWLAEHGSKDLYERDRNTPKRIEYHPSRVPT